MKITSSNGVSATPVGPGGRRVAGAGFSLSETAGASGPSAKAPASGVSALGSVDALIALQEVDGPLERKRRAIRRATRVLDALDQLKLALLEGEPSRADLQQLAESVREQRATTDDPGLQALLDQIETRAAVELAKLTPSGS
jgi:hypothetical protein